MTTPEFPIDGPPPGLRDRVLAAARETPQEPGPGAGSPWAGLIAAAVLFGAGLAPLLPGTGAEEGSRSARFVSGTRRVCITWLASFTGRR